MVPSCTSIDNLNAWKHLSKPFIRPGLPVFRKLWHIETTPFKKFMTNLRKRKKAHSRTSLSNVHRETQKLRRQNTNVLSFVKRAVPSFPRDRWRKCRLNSSNSIGSERCLEFVVFSQPMVRVMIIHNWMTTFIVVHDRFATNGYALPVPHKMDLQWKPESNFYNKFSHVYYMKYWSKLLQLCIVSAFAYANSRRVHSLEILYTCTWGICLLPYSSLAWETKYL